MAVRRIDCECSSAVHVRQGLHLSTLASGVLCGAFPQGPGLTPPRERWDMKPVRPRWVCMGEEQRETCGEGEEEEEPPWEGEE